MSGFEFGADPNRVIHEPARLKIMAILSVAEEADFTYLMHETQLTRGNLSVQMSRLEDAGYLEISKSFIGKMPRTTASMTSAGRAAFEDYRRYLSSLLSATDQP